MMNNNRLNYRSPRLLNSIFKNISRFVSLFKIFKQEYNYGYKIRNNFVQIQYELIRVI